MWRGCAIGWTYQSRGAKRSNEPEGNQPCKHWVALLPLALTLVSIPLFWLPWPEKPRRVAPRAVRLPGGRGGAAWKLFENPAIRKFPEIGVKITRLCFKFHSIYIYIYPSLDWRIGLSTGSTRLAPRAVSLAIFLFFPLAPVITLFISLVLINVFCFFFLVYAEWFVFRWHFGFFFFYYTVFSRPVWYIYPNTNNERYRSFLELDSNLKSQSLYRKSTVPEPHLQSDSKKFWFKRLEGKRRQRKKLR